MGYLFPGQAWEESVPEGGPIMAVNESWSGEMIGASAALAPELGLRSRRGSRTGPSGGGLRRPGGMGTGRGFCDHRSGMPLALPMQRMLRRYAGDCGYSRAL